MVPYDHTLLLTPTPCVLVHPLWSHVLQQVAFQPFRPGCYQGLRSPCVLALVLLYCFQRYILIQRDLNGQEFFVPTDFGQFLPMSPPAPCPTRAPPSGRLFWETDFFRCGPIMFWRVQRNAYGSYELAHTSYVQIGPLEKKLGPKRCHFLTP